MFFTNDSTIPIFTFYIKNQMEAKLTLIGAGPGDAELITLKGVKALNNADVILYDELANAQMLEFAPEHALKIYVGKKAGDAAFSQNEINALIVRLARKRGHEEMEYARDHGISVEVIPGVSSCIAVPASLDIPVTRRGVSESFWVFAFKTVADPSARRTPASAAARLSCRS